MAKTSAQTSQTAGVSYLYMAAAFVIVVAGMHAAKPILNPLLLAVFLAVISAPAYFALLKKKYSDWLALLIVIGVLSSVVLGVGYVVVNSIAGFTSQQEHYTEQLAERKRELQAEFQKWIPDWSDAAENEEDETSSASDEKDNTNSSEAVETRPGPTEQKASSPEPSDDPASEQKQENDSDNTDVVIAGPLEESEDVSNESQPELSGTSEAKIATPTLKKPKTSVVPAQLDLGLTEPQDVPKDEAEWRDYIEGLFDPAKVISLAVDFASNIGTLVGNTFLVLLTVIFILLEAGTFRRKINDAFANNDATVRAQEIIGSMQNYIVIKTWVSLATGAMIAVWLWFLGVPHYALWGLLAFMFNFIPNIGSVIAAVPAVLIAWLDLTTLPAIAAAIGFVLVNGIVGNFIEPRLMGKGLGLSPLVVFFSMVFWGWVLGPVGMLLSVPLTMTARIALGGFEDTRWVATLLGNAEST